MSDRILADDEVVLNAVVEGLRSMPRQQRNAVIAFLSNWHALDLETLGIYLLCDNEDRTNAEIAALCGVPPCKVSRWDRFRDIRKRLKTRASVFLCDDPEKVAKRGRSSHDSPFPADVDLL